MTKLKFVLAITLFFCVLPCLAKHNGDYLNKITTKYITPHLTWAKPLVDRKITCLFLVARHGAREVVELWQRLDIDFDGFTTWWAGELAKEDMYEAAIEGTSKREKKAEILAKLEKKFDAIVISCGFDILPAEARVKILEKAYNGTGLIFFDPSIDRVYKKVFTEKVDAGEAFIGAPIEGIPGFRKNFFKGYKYGNGRILIMSGGPMGGWSSYYGGTSLTVPETYSRFWKAHYENNMVAIAKALLWVTKRQPSCFISQQSFSNGESFDQASLPKDLQFTLVGAPGENYHIMLRLRDEWNKVIEEKSVKIKISGNQANIPYTVPFLKSGKYYLDYIVRDEKKIVMDFGYSVFTITSSVGNVSITTEKNYYDKGEKIIGTLEIENPLKETASALVQIFDSPSEKIWYRKVMPLEPGQKQLNFEFTLTEFPTLYGYIEAEIIQNGMVLTKCEKGLSFPCRTMPLYPSFVWSFNTTPYPEFYLPQLIKAGFDALQAEPETSAKFNLRTWPMVTRIFLTVDTSPERKGWMGLSGIKNALPRNEDIIKKIDPEMTSKKLIEIGDFSLYNPVIKEVFKEGIRRQVRKDFPPLFYNFGDENAYRLEGGYSPSENKEFIKFLRERYGNIERLNEQWGESFKNFEEVKHYYLEDIRKLKNYAAYMDHTMFVAKEYADAHHIAAEAVKEVDPDAFVGAEGSPSGNLEYIISKLDVWGPYSDTIENELMRCFGKDKLRTIWWGGYVGTHGGRNEVPIPLWRYLLSGIVNGNSFFMAGPWNEGFLSVDLSYASYFEKMFPHIKKLKDGIAHLLITNDLKNYGIAVLYSYPSAVMSYFGEKKFVPLSSSCSSLINFCYRNGFNFDFLNSTMIKQGALQRYKILFLFGATCISDEEKEAIEGFVKNGGIVISDLNPGISNEFGKLLEKSSFSSLFGYDIHPVEDFVLQEVRVDRQINGKKVHLFAQNIPCSPDGEVFKFNTNGKGMAILLNFTLSSIFNNIASINDFDNFMLDLLSLADIKKEVTIEDFPGTIDRIVIRKARDFEILGVIAYMYNFSGERNIKIKLDSGYYVYQVDRGFFQQGSEITDKMTYSPVLFLYSLFKEKQESPKIRIESKNVRQGESIQLDFPVQKESRIYRVRVVGGENEIYQRIITSDTKHLSIPVAYNEQIGKYTVEVTDVLTGLNSQETINIQGTKK
ncbi:MAG: beta-galactosidase [Candidatus Ratteibacteria bacterium]